MGKQLVIIGADFSAVAIGDAKVLSSLAITTPPSKTTYTQGESFDPTGMVVRATYTDGTTSTSINYTYSPTILNTVGSQVITVSYTAGGVTQTATYTVTVQQGTGTTWTVTPNISNGSAQGITVADGGTATLTITPSSGYTNPTSATVTSGTAGTPTVSGNTITIPNVQSDITVSATCPSTSSYIVSAIATNGTISPSSAPVVSGGNATFTVTPATGYAVAAGDVSITSGSGNCGTPTVSGTTLTIPNVTGNVTIVVACHESGGGDWENIVMQYGNNFSAGFVGNHGRLSPQKFVQVHTGDSVVLHNPGTTSSTIKWAIYYSNTNYTEDIYQYAVEHGSAAYTDTIGGASWSTTTPINITSQYDGKYIAPVVCSGDGATELDNTKTLSYYITINRA